MGIDCRRRGVVYEIECEEERCRKKYIGQTGRTIHERLKEHTKKSRDNTQKEQTCSAVQQHKKESHGGRDFKFKVKIKENCFGKPTKRIITEAIKIDNLDRKKSFNRKQGWSNTTLYREPFNNTSLEEGEEEEEEEREEDID